MKTKVCFLTLLLIFYSLLFTSVFFASPNVDIENKSVNFLLKELSSTNTFELSNYSGKTPVLINFFTTWCPYCVREIPELNKIVSKYGPKMLTVVSINVQERERKVVNFVVREKILHKVLLDTQAEVTKKFKIHGLPTNILIDSKGMIVFRGNNLPQESDIEKVLLHQKQDLPMRATKKKRKLKVARE
ncbi:MAG: TlpA disulfide reductase family protein [Elusimicrobiota bacterium]